MRTSPDNILLRLPEAQEQQIREVFVALEARGFPAQQQTPHITITSSPAMAEEAVHCAARLLPSLIPARLERVGTVILGRSANKPSLGYSKPPLNWKLRRARLVR